MKVLIIEDERLIAESLEQYILESRPDVSISGPFGKRDDILTFLQNEEPDLIFSDIQLEDCISIDVLLESKVKIPTIFCTAFDEYALRAFDVNGIHYVMKPYSKSDIEKALSKYSELVSESVDDKWAALEQLLHQRNAPANRIIVHQGERIIPVDTEEIALIALQNEIVYAFTFDGQKYTLNDPLNEFQKQLETSHYRVNRQSIIHKNNVDYVTHHFNRKLKIHPKIGSSEELIVSKTNATSFLNWLKL